MKIAAALTGMDAARTYTEVNSFTLGLAAEQQASPFEPDHFSTRFRSLINTPSLQPVSKPAHKQQSDPVDPTGDMELNRSQSGNEILRALTGEIIGRPIRITATDNKKEPDLNPTPMQATVTSRLIHYEREEVYFSSSGMVATEDGREISFSLDISMQRSSIETLELSAQNDALAQYLLDPLILSFTGGPPAFSATSFLFDLDCDGREDEIAGLQPGCGFLAFDKNEDGIINNGMELFGPESGNGFTDLSAFDTDSNLWIDENDQIFDSLSIWRPDEQGVDSLQSLKEAGVGAISLSNVGTLFTLQGSDNAILGQVTANGIFLTEKGEVRSLQEVDLAIGDPEQEVEKEGSSALEVLHEAMFSLRILIAMQKMRARLDTAGVRLEKLFKQAPFTAEQLHPHSQSPQPIQMEPAIDESMGTGTATEEISGLEPVDRQPEGIARLRATMEIFNQPDTLFQPMLSLSEMEDYAWSGRFRKRQNPL